MDPLTFAKLWLVVRPVKRIKAALQRRKAKAGKPVDEVAEEFNSPDEVPMDKLKEFLAKYRTSTKAGAAGLVVPALVLLPFYDEVNGYLTQACQSGDGPLAALAAGGVTWLSMYVSARFSKTPAQPGAL